MMWKSVLGYEGTRESNNRDKERHGTMPRGAKNPNALLTDDKIVEIRSLVSRPATKQRVSEIAGMYGVSTSLVRRIVYREVWKHVAWDVTEEQAA